MCYTEKWCIWSQFFCFCIEKWGMRISKNSFRKKILHSYVLYWKMRVLKSILLFYIEKWGFLRTLFRKMLYSYVLYWKMMFWSKILCFCIEKWGMRISKNSFRKNFAFLCIILKNDVFEVNSFVLYWKMRISKNSFVKKFYSYVLYWKMMFSKSILLFCIEKWGMRIS